MSKKRFRIAFSFAGEKREFVSKVAAIGLIYAIATAAAFVVMVYWVSITA